MYCTELIVNIFFFDNKEVEEANNRITGSLEIEGIEYNINSEKQFKQKGQLFSLGDLYFNIISKSEQGK